MIHGGDRLGQRRTARAGAMLLCGVMGVGSRTAEGAESSAPMPGSFRNPAAVEEVRRGERTVANAAWWGFDPVDATEAIQSAIDSRAAKVIVPYVGAEWVVRPVTLASNQELVLDPGVVVVAKRGEFHGMRDSLFTGTGVENVTVRGYGAVLRMWQEDYVSGAYEQSEFRHTLAFRGSGKIAVLGLTLEHSGGDGIYLGPIEDERRLGCRDVLIRDCVCRNNYRQGMSLLSGEQVRIEHCVFRNTRGTAPQAGLDLEPGSARDALIDIAVLNCISEDNEGSAFVVNVMRLTPDSQPVDVRFWNCLGRNTRHPGLRVMVGEERVPRGRIEFVACTIERTEYSGLYCAWNPSGDLQLRFSDCKWNMVARKRTEFPLQVKFVAREDRSGLGRIEFVRSYLYDDRERSALQFSGRMEHSFAEGISGELYVVNPRSSITTQDPFLQKTHLQVHVHGP